MSSFRTAKQHVRSSASPELEKRQEEGERRGEREGKNETVSALVEPPELGLGRSFALPPAVVGDLLELVHLRLGDDLVLAAGEEEDRQVRGEGREEGGGGPDLCGSNPGEGSDRG